MVNDGKFEAATRQRYAGWERDLGQKILAGKLSLADLSKQVLDSNLEPRPKSGRQEFLENFANRYL
jgi:xylose isomerase